MFIPNAMLSRLIRGIVTDRPHRVEKIKALAPVGAVAAAADTYARAPQRRRPSPPPLDEDSQAAVVGMRALDAHTTVRAMIAAAAADGEIDGREKGHIVRYLRDSGAPQAELTFAEGEMRRPATPQELARAAGDNPEAAAEIYAAALLATEAATAGGRSFLASLAEALHLPQAFVAQLHASWGDPPPEAPPPSTGS